MRSPDEEVALPLLPATLLNRFKAVAREPPLWRFPATLAAAAPVAFDAVEPLAVALPDDEEVWAVAEPEVLAVDAVEDEAGEAVELLEPVLEAMEMAVDGFVETFALGP